MQNIVIEYKQSGVFMKKLLALCLFSLGALQVFSGDVRLELAGPQRPLISAGTGSKKIEVAVSGRLEGVKLHIIAREYAVKKILARSVPVTAKPKTEITIPLKQVGFYELTVIATESGKELERKTVNYAVVPEPDYDRPEEMGTCIHFAFSGKGIRGHFPYTFELLKLAGFTRIRDDLAWESIEKKPGKYEIPERLERMINTVPEYGIKPLLVTGYNNGKAYPGKFKKSFPTTREMREAFGNAVAYAVQYFGSRVTEWEIWNEPNSAHPVNDYLPLLKTVYPKIKAANPEATVISCGGGGAGGGPGGAMILPIANADGLRFMDGFSIHPYMSPGYDPDFGYSAKGSPIPRVSVPHFMEHLHRNFSRRKKRPDGISPKLYVTEVGWYVQHPGERQATCTELVQAAYFARLYLLGRAASNGAVPIYWYDFQNDGTDPLEREHNFGLIRWDFSPKPAYQAAAVVASMLQNRPFVKAIRDNVTVSPADRNRDLLRSGIVKLYLYGQDNDRMLAAWTAQGDPQIWNRKCKVTFTLPFPYESATLTDWSGKNLPMPEKLDGNRIELELDFLPKYITQK
jgi:hypothetical protein